MSDEGGVHIHHLPDDGRWYSPGERVRVDRTGGAPDVIPAPRGEYEVVTCRHATDMGGGPPIVRMELRRVGA
jgi:hypothetical protein